MRITETKEVDADFSQKTDDEIIELFYEFFDLIVDKTSNVQYREFLKRAREHINECCEGWDIDADTNT